MVRGRAAENDERQIGESDVRTRRKWSESSVRLYQAERTTEDAGLLGVLWPTKSASVPLLIDQLLQLVGFGRV